MGCDVILVQPPPSRPAVEGFIKIGADRHMPCYAFFVGTWSSFSGRQEHDKGPIAQFIAWGEEADVDHNDTCAVSSANFADMRCTGQGDFVQQAQYALLQSWGVVNE